VADRVIALIDEFDCYDEKELVWECHTLYFRCLVMKKGPMELAKRRLEIVADGIECCDVCCIGRCLKAIVGIAAIDSGTELMDTIDQLVYEMLKIRRWNADVGVCVSAMLGYLREEDVIKLFKSLVNTMRGRRATAQLRWLLVKSAVFIHGREDLAEKMLTIIEVSRDDQKFIERFDIDRDCLYE
jgi:hypothetical protein